MDCSWGYGYNMACDGGDYDKGLDYLIESGGAVLDSEYEYLGVDNFCLNTTAPRTKIKARLRQQMFYRNKKNPK